jgi:hypothetical protein
MVPSVKICFWLFRNSASTTIDEFCRQASIVYEKKYSSDEPANLGSRLTAWRPPERRASFALFAELTSKPWIRRPAVQTSGAAQANQDYYHSGIDYRNQPSEDELISYVITRISAWHAGFRRMSLSPLELGRRRNREFIFRCNTVLCIVAPYSVWLQLHGYSSTLLPRQRHVNAVFGARPQ